MPGKRATTRCGPETYVSSGTRKVPYARITCGKEAGRPHTIKRNKPCSRSIPTISPCGVHDIETKGKCPLARERTNLVESPSVVETFRALVTLRKVSRYKENVWAQRRVGRLIRSPLAVLACLAHWTPHGEAVCQSEGCKATQWLNNCVHCCKTQAGGLTHVLWRHWSSQFACLHSSLA